MLSEAEKQRLEQLLAQDEEDDTETEVRDQPLYHSPTLTDIHCITIAVGIYSIVQCDSYTYGHITVGIYMHMYHL